MDGKKMPMLVTSLPTQVPLDGTIPPAAGGAISTENANTTAIGAKVPVTFRPRPAMDASSSKHASNDTSTKLTIADQSAKSASTGVSLQLAKTKVPVKPPGRPQQVRLGECVGTATCVSLFLGGWSAPKTPSLFMLKRVVRWKDSQRVRS